MRKIKKKKKTIKNLIIISLIAIILSILSVFIYKKYQENKDIHHDTNLLLGTWIYNEYGGTYIFNKDYTYLQYTNEDISDNYCKGTYKYSYGINNKGIMLREDDNYYYYYLTLNINECTIMKKQTNEKYIKKMYFGINKNNNLDKIIFANQETKNIMTLTKIN